MLEHVSPAQQVRNSGDNPDTLISEATGEGNGQELESDDRASDRSPLEPPSEDGLDPAPSEPVVECPEGERVAPEVVVGLTSVSPVVLTAVVFVGGEAVLFFWLDLVGS